MVVADSCTCSRKKWQRAERRRWHDLETIALTTFAYFYVKPWNKNLENKTAVSTLHSTGRKFILKRTYRRQEKIKVLRENRVIYSVRISAKLAIGVISLTYERILHGGEIEKIWILCSSGKKNISHSFAALTCEILFLPREHRIHIFKLTCNVLLLYRHTDEGIFDDFLKSSEDFQNCPEDKTNVPEHFPKIFEDFRRLSFRGRPEGISIIHHRI